MASARPTFKLPRPGFARSPRGLSRFRGRGAGCGVFLIFFCCLALPGLFGQSNTNALPQLLPPAGPIPPTFLEEYGMEILAGGLMVLALAAAGVWKILKSAPAPIVPPAVAAREALAPCRSRTEDGETLSRVSQVLRRYVAAVLELPPGEFTTAELCAELERHDRMGPELRRAVFDFLRACDERKFSSTVSREPFGAAGRALQLVDQIESGRRGQDAHPAQR